MILRSRHEGKERYIGVNRAIGAASIEITRYADEPYREGKACISDRNTIMRSEAVACQGWARCKEMGLQRPSSRQKVKAIRFVSQPSSRGAPVSHRSIQSWK